MRPAPITAPVLLAVGILLALTACGGDAGPGEGGSGGHPGWPPPAPEPPVGEVITGLDFLVNWEDPRLLPEPIFSEGWEDSAFISADGTTLYFGYTLLDFYQLSQNQQLVSSGPPRPGQLGPGFDIYEARIAGGGWQVWHSTVNSSPPELNEAAIGVDRLQQQMAFARFDGPQGEGDIYLSHKGSDGVWGPAERLPAPVNTPCNEDNPHLSPDGTTLYFDSNSDPATGTCRPDSSGEPQQTIYAAHFDGAGWSPPAALRGALAGQQAGVAHWQVFTTDDDGATAYWTGTDGTCVAMSCIYRAHRQADGSYHDSEVVATPTAPANAGPTDAVAIGEISLTADGRFFYFVVVRLIQPDQPELSIGVTRRRH